MPKRNINRYACYNRVSRREQARDSDALVRQQWQTARVAREYDPSFLEFTDVQTGRRDDRPEFQKLYKMIESLTIDCVVVSRIDRITRDLEMNARLAKLFEKTGIQVYEVLLGRTINFKNDNDWEYFVNSGVKAEGESRRLSNRILQTYDWLREQGKPAGGGLVLGYRKSTDKLYEPDPNQWDKLISIIKIVIECGGSTALAAQRVRDEVGLEYTRTGLYGLIRSPTIRGNTKQNSNIIYGTHPSVFDAPELIAIGAKESINHLVSIAGNQRGRTRYQRTYPLSGLVKCARCNSPCHIKTMKGKSNKLYTYICCGYRQSKAGDCGGKYGTMQGLKGSINTPYILADNTVTDALRNAAAQMVDRALENSSPKDLESAEAKKVREQIEHLESMNDPDLADAIEKKRRLYQEIMNIPLVNLELQLSREKLATLAANPLFWKLINDDEKAKLYREFIESVSCDRLSVIVKLRI